MPQKIDLHLHSSFSDGELSPTELIKRCAALEMRTVGIADHDTIDHIPEAMEAGKKYGITTISATELSVVHRNFAFHLLVYGFDPENKLLREKINYFRESHKKQAEEIKNVLSDLGITFSLEEFEKKSGADCVKAQIAQAAVACEKNSGMLKKEGVFNSSDFIKHYLAKGKPANIPQERFSAKEAISIAQEAGGKSFIAHPKITIGTSYDRIVSLVDTLYTFGLDGIEIFHPDHQTRRQVQLLRKITQTYKLLESAGSDFHGLNTPHRIGEWNNFGLIPRMEWLK